MKAKIKSILGVVGHGLKRLWGVFFSALLVKNLWVVVWRAINTIILWRFAFGCLCNLVKVTPWLMYFHDNMTLEQVELTRNICFYLTLMGAIWIVVAIRDVCHKGKERYMVETAVTLIISASVGTIAGAKATPFFWATIAMLLAAIEATMTEDVNILHLGEEKKK